MIMRMIMQRVIFRHFPFYSFELCSFHLDHSEFVFSGIHTIRNVAVRQPFPVRVFDDFRGISCLVSSR